MIVDCEASQVPRSMQRRWTSAVERRESGASSPGGSQATALTSAICSGGKAARPTWPRSVLESLEALVVKAFSPAANGPVADLQPPADLGVRMAVGGEQDQLRPQDLAVRAGVAGDAVSELSVLCLAEGDLVGGGTGHLRSTSPQLS